ncbi:MAG: HD-GYP domain-containing protein [Eubacteriales bacterium]
MDKIKVKLHELLMCFSGAQDLISPSLTNHHQRVAYLSYRLAEETGLSAEQQKEVFLAALVHDIGAGSLGERLDILEKEPATINSHAFKSAKLLEGIRFFAKETDIIRYHHQSWHNGNGLMYLNKAIPFSSHVIHLADRVCSMIRPSRNVLSQIPVILSEIEQKNKTVFEPGLVAALFELSKKDYVWLDLVSHAPVKKLPENAFETFLTDMDDIINITCVFSHIIDFKSKFTTKHSAGVAKTAERLAEFAGFSSSESKMMLIAGYLHDLGKLAVNNAVLEKPAKLNKDEFNEIRSHAYNTYRLLDTIPQFEIIKEWASYHHERPDGMGYPFGIKGDKLSAGSRIMAVADVFTAMTENRAYRRGMDDESVIQLLNNMVTGGAIDGETVKLLLSNYSEIVHLKQQAQKESSGRYEQFLLPYYA